MAEASGSGALGVVVGVLLAVALIGGGLFLYNSNVGASKGPSITIKTTN